MQIEVLIAHPGKIIAAYVCLESVSDLLLTLLLAFEEVYTQHMLVLLAQILHVLHKELVSEFVAACNLCLCRNTSLLEKNGYIAPYLHICTTEIFILNDLLQLNKICDVSPVINTARQVACPTAKGRATRKQIKI